jgi:hemerythrin-like domain-containing protein
MLPIAPLMVEHRLIERVIELMAAEVQKINSHKQPDVDFIRLAVEFMRTYADQLHHGKEENILFRDLGRKQLSPEHQQVMLELVAEHAAGRENVRALVASLDHYLGGAKDSAAGIAQHMEVLVNFYPVHIAKEDKQFFTPIMDYFNAAEQEDMLRAFYEFDRKFIHLKYRELVSLLDGKRAEPLH